MNDTSQPGAPETGISETSPDTPETDTAPDETAPNTPETDTSATETAIPSAAAVSRHTEAAAYETRPDNAETPPDTTDTESSEDPALAELIRCLSRRYNVPPDAYGDMLAFLQADATRLPEHLIRLGLSPSAMRLSRLYAARETLSRRVSEARSTARMWLDEARASGCDLTAELKDPLFGACLRCGMSVKEAHARVHARETAMRDIEDRIAARAARPLETGAYRGASGDVRDTLPGTRAARELIEKRALHGEKIRL